MAGGMVAIGEGTETKALLDLARPASRCTSADRRQGQELYNDVARAYGCEEEAEEIQDLLPVGQEEGGGGARPEEWLEAASLVGPK